jgi:hypothetical protein
MARFGSGLYRAARIVNTVSRPTPRRLKNIAVGRAAARAGFWSWLFGGGGNR